MSSDSDVFQNWMRKDDEEEFHASEIPSLDQLSENDSKDWSTFGIDSLFVGSSRSGLVFEQEEYDDHTTTIRFADNISTPIDCDLPASNTIEDEAEDDEYVSELTAEETDDEEDEDTKIKKQLAWAAAGMGMAALMGFAIKKLTNFFNKNAEDDSDLANVAETGIDVNDIAGAAMGDGGQSSAFASAASSSADIANASFNASAQTSQTNFATFGLAGAKGGTGMSAAQ